MTNKTHATAPSTQPPPTARRHLHSLALACIFTLCSFTSGQGWAQTVYKSTQAPKTLLELYTSEGCNACPPAERWLNNLTEANDLWQTLFPLAFHVDYWDFLGWSDPYADERWSHRQRQHARLGNTSGVYTPGILTSGREWHGWRRYDTAPAFSPSGALTVEINDATQRFTADYQRPSAAAATAPLTLNVALLGFGLQTDVRAGENRGKRLTHDFVVLGMIEKTGSVATWSGPLPQSQLAAKAKRLALVAWVSAKGTQRPLQMAGGWLPARFSETGAVDNAGAVRDIDR